MDLGISLASLLLAAPLMVVLAIAIRLDSPGPVFFRQERIGRNGSTFWMLKFRTMRHAPGVQLEKLLSGNPALRLTYEQNQKLIADPRITRLGRLLRRTSLDELPQLWNVLMGEMSLVGPRPFLASQLSDYGSLYVRYIRFQPGITGLWQVSGRNTLSFRERVDLDQGYFDRWSLSLDIQILFWTVWAVLRGTGAY
jgi:lipopolysaccharide/colanic/teichoic acid biosynthesis glycosyltransferase